ncbi:MAG: hypothetical protein J6T03_03670 [Bacteroidales bacterium]|nr:hypothetical protein [Bacteroidales bacterium]
MNTKGLQLALGVLLLLAAVQPAVGQNSIVKKYTALEGDSALIRTDNSTFVTCCNTTDMRSCFVVDDGTTCRQFFTTQVPSGIYITDSGYVVKDMQLVNGVCWFAGYKWVDTGQLVYTPGGEVYNLVTYTAFVGKFNTADVLSGSGDYSIIEISGLHHIERLAVIGNNVTAIGVKTNGVRKLVDLYKMLFLGYTVRIEESTLSQEVFMDVVAAGDKVVVLSRFSTPGSTELEKYFGLRYGSAGSMYGNTTLHCYDVSTAYNSYLTFPSLHPIRLAATNNGNGVVVGYVAQYYDLPNGNPLCYKFALFHIAAESDSSMDVIINTDGEKYTDIVDIRFNKPVTNNAHMALLLAAGSSYRYLRFPPLSLSSPTTDDILYIYSPFIQSIAPYQTASTGLELAATGHYYPGITPYAMEVKEEGILNHTGTFYTQNCFQISEGELSSDIANKNDNLTYSLNTLSVQQFVRFTNHPYTSSNVSRITTCVDGN